MSSPDSVTLYFNLKSSSDSVSLDENDRLEDKNEPNFRQIYLLSKSQEIMDKNSKKRPKLRKYNSL